MKLAPGEMHEPFPLTDIQQAYWIGRTATFELGNVSTHAYLEIDCPDLDLERFNLAWRRVIERHAMLRAIVLPDGRQQILSQVPDYQIKRVDLRDQDEAAIAAQLEAARERLSHQVLPADQWPLFEICACELPDGRTRLHFSIDLLIADAWSFQILSRELWQYYRQPDFQFPPLELSFRDYVLAEAGQADSQACRRALEYWHSRLAALPPAPDLPLAHNPASISKPQFVRRTARLEPEAWRRFKSLAAEAGLTPAGALLAAFAEVLAAWSKSPRFTLNLTLFNRLPLHPQVNDLVGDFTSVLLLEVNATPGDGFAERARRLQKQLWQDLNHRQVGGIRVLREMARRQGNSAITTMPVVFTSLLHQEASAPMTWLGEPAYGVSQTPQVWLDHQVSEQEGALVYNWDAVEALFPGGLLDDMFDSYSRFLQRLSGEPELWQAAACGLLPPAQLEQRMAVNATNAPVPGGLLHTLFAGQVPERPHQPAVLSADCKLTYEELFLRANAIGHRLRALGVSPNTLVGVVMEKGWEQVVAVLGIFAAGAAYLPIDPELPKERQWYLLENGRVKVALTQPWLETALEWPPEVIRICVDGGPIGDDAHRPLAPVQTPEDLAYVIFTSGSTGQPKGVMIDHRGAVNTIVDLNHRFNVTADDRVLALSNLNFDLSVYDIFGTLAAGGTIVMPDHAGRRDPAHWADLLLRERVTIWNSVPALMQMLAEHLGSRAEEADRGKRSSSSLRLVMMSGDWIPMPLPEQIWALFPAVELFSLGGATEASIWSILYPIGRVDPDWKSIPYGKPMVNQTFHVLNEALEPCPVWVPGDLFIGGIGLAKGYWRDEEKTRARFFDHPRTGERLYRTGDLGRYLPDGNIEFLGREDFQVKIRGHRIELGEIETVLTQHPQVQAAVVNAVGEARSHRRLVAYIVPDAKEESSNGAVPAPDPTWAAGLQAGAQQAEQTPSGSGLVASMMERFDRLTAAYLAGALRQLNAYAAPGEAYTVDELLTRCRVLPRYRKWLLRCLRILSEAGLLRRVGERYEGVRALPEGGVPPALWEEIEGHVKGAHTRLIRAAGEHLAAIITGQAHAAQFLFPAGEAQQAEQLYAENFHDCNLIARAAVQAAVKARPADKPIRILEIGAGVGSTTEYLLPVLPADRTRYDYTDISRYFMQVGQDRFAAFPFVNYRLLNIEKDPEIQGFDRHGFDIVVAASVLHATRDIAETLRHVRPLLAPGGLLVLVEETRFHRVFNLSMGLQQGFDRFEDTALRALHPLLSIEQWKAALAAHGFEDFTAFRKPDSDAAFLGFEVLLARAGAEAPTLDINTLGQFLRQKLPDYMVPSAFVVLEALPLTSNGKVDRKALPLPAEAETKSERVFAPPRNALEQTLVSIWQEVLQLEQVGIHDNFFDLGGDSLFMTRAHGRLREQLDREVTIVELFQHPTIGALADYLSRTEQDPPAFRAQQARASARQAARQGRPGPRPQAIVHSEE